MRPGTDPEVDAYVAALPAWQQDVCGAVRAQARGADARMEEALGPEGHPLFSLAGRVGGLRAARRWVQVDLYGGLAPGGARARRPGADAPETVTFWEGEEVYAAALRARFRAIIAHNRARG